MLNGLSLCIGFGSRAALISDLLRNGEFTSDISYWVDGSTDSNYIEWVSGSLHLVDLGAGRAEASQAVTGLTIGQVYALTVTQSGGGGVSVLINDSSSVGGSYNNSAETDAEFTIAFTATGTEANVAFRGPGGSVNATVDSASLQLVNEVITATVEPSMGAGLYSGQSVSDVTSYSTMIDMANFSSVAGTISSVALAFQGDAVDASTVLSEGETAGFTVTVTDSGGNERVFTASPITVEAPVTFVITAGNEVEVVVSDLLDDVDSAPFAITGGTDFDGSYTPTAGDLRNGPWFLSVSITGSTDLGDTLTAVYAATTPTGELTYSTQWYANGAPISGATSDTFDITASEQGADVTVTVTADDGANGAVSITSAATTIPAGHGTLGLIYDSVISTDNDTDYDEDFSAIDWSAANEGDTLVLVVLAGVSAGVGQYTAAEIDGVSMTQQAVAYSATEAQMVSIFTGARPAATSGTINISGSGSGAGRPKKIALFGAGPYDTLVDSATANGDAASQDISVNTTGDCLLIAGSVSRDSGALSYSGVTERDNESFVYGVDWEFASAFDEVSSAETPRSVTSVCGSAFNHAAAAITLGQS